MPILEWNDALDIGVNDMNQEHKKLLALMNELYDKNAAGANKTSLSKTLNELAAYTVKHFADEEAYLEKIGYPELSKHKWIHQDLLTKFGKHKAEFDSGANPKMNDEFFKFLKLWLSSHIKGIDRMYGDFARQSKKAA